MTPLSATIRTPRVGLFATFALALFISAGPVSAKEPKSIAPGTRFNDCGANCPDMMAVPAGTFKMGADVGEEGRPEGPVRSITIARPFALGVFEVTNAQYSRFIAQTGHIPAKGCRSLVGGKVEVVPEADYLHPGAGAGEGAPGKPVVCVSWRDAKAYTAWLSKKTGQPYRLPTEAEWEYAARGGKPGEYYWGQSIDTGCAHANVYDKAGASAGVIPVFSAAGGAPAVPFAQCSDGHAGAAPVGSFAPNAFGLFDMTGNVWEWTQDCYFAPYPATAPIDGSAYEISGECPRRAVRGGSWMSAPFRNRTSWRGRDPEDLVTWIFGFRVARDLPVSGSK